MVLMLRTSRLPLFPIFAIARVVDAIELLPYLLPVRASRRSTHARTLISPMLPMQVARAYMPERTQYQFLRFPAHPCSPLDHATPSKKVKVLGLIEPATLNRPKHRAHGSPVGLGGLVACSLASPAFAAAAAGFVLLAHRKLRAGGWGVVLETVANPTLTMVLEKYLGLNPQPQNPRIQHLNPKIPSPP